MQPFNALLLLWYDLGLWQRATNPRLHSRVGCLLVIEPDWTDGIIAGPKNAISIISPVVPMEEMVQNGPAYEAVIMRKRAFQPIVCSSNNFASSLTFDVGLCISDRENLLFFLILLAEQLQIGLDE